MSARHGLTLIEVLASAGLLSLLAAACGPLLREAAIAAPTDPPDIDLLDLAGLAETALTHAAAGDAGAFAATGDVVRLEWPDHPGRSPVHARVVFAVDPGADHAWVVFECGDLAISRCVTVAPSAIAEVSR